MSSRTKSVGELKEEKKKKKEKREKNDLTIRSEPRSKPFQ
jgi:hypothetical protein